VNGKKVALPFAQVRSLAWSADGTRFLVAAKPKGAPTFDVYTVETDGTDVQRLTFNLDVSSADWR
jgi:Tol biopolymer transport system component